MRRQLREIVDRVIGLENVKADIATLLTPDVGSRVELTKFHTPATIKAQKKSVNTLGIGRIMFAVDDLNELLARLRNHGAELVGELVQYENFYRLCYVRGPEDIIIGLAERIG